jgi:hypothetical protein
MELTPFYFMISQGPNAMVRAFLNDVPFYRFYGPEPVNRTGPAIHLLVPGENTFAIEIERADTANQIFFELSVNWNHKEPAFYFEWPRDAAHLPRDRRVPFRFETRFSPEGNLFQPVWLSAPPVDVPCSGTPELKDALRRLHAAIEARDVNAYCSEFSLKAREQERAYPGWPASSAADMRAGVGDFFRMDLSLRQLELDDIHFELRSGGRLAHARRTSGDFVIDAITLDRTADDEQARLSMDPTFVRHEGRWQLIH